MDEQRTDPLVTTVAGPIEELHRYLADSDSRKQLYGVLRSYVSKSGIVPAGEVANETDDLFQDLVRKALEIAYKYQGVGIRPWLLRIAQNLLQQKRESRTRYQQHVILMGDM